MNKKFIVETVKEMIKQDNCMTALPVYQVRTKDYISSDSECHLGDLYLGIYGEDGLIEILEQNEVKDGFELFEQIFNIVFDGYSSDEKEENYSELKKHVSNWMSIDEIENLFENIDHRVSPLWLQKIEEVDREFLTRKGAEEYLRCNRHNLKEPFIYVDCNFRNFEWMRNLAYMFKIARDEGVNIEPLRNAYHTIFYRFIDKDKPKFIGNFARKPINRKRFKRNLELE